MLASLESHRPHQASKEKCARTQRMPKQNTYLKEMSTADRDGELAGSRHFHTHANSCYANAAH